MRNGLKKVMALMMTLMMILSLVPATVFADTTSNTVVVNGVAPQADGDGQETAQDGEKKETYSIVINYVFADGKQAANPWTATIAKGSSYSQEVKSPKVIGYIPDVASVMVKVDNASKDTIYTVTYQPAEVEYTVNHFKQNVNDDGYTLAEAETKKGLTESKIPDNLAKTDYTGFTALLYDNDLTIAADSSTVVNIYYDRNYYLLSLDLDGGFGSEPVYARYGAEVSVKDPQKPGYKFNGWNPVIPSTMPAENVRHTALWAADKASYVIQYWQENANDNDYSFVESKQVSNAAVGSTVSGINDKSYTGFTYSHADTDVEVKGDGTTVVNVYYKRNVYEIKFYEDKGSWTTNWQEITSLRITAKYGANISDKWPTYKNSNAWSTTNTYSYGSLDGPFQSNIDVMPLNGTSFYGPNTDSGSESAYYYVEVLPGETEDETYQNVKYKLHHTDTSRGTGYVVTDEDKYPITGFTYETLKADRTSSGKYKYNEAKFYYKRNQYKLIYDDNYNTTVEDSMYYEQKLSASAKYQAGYVPAYPEKLESGAYKFGGWYMDPGCTTPVDWDNATMPAANVKVYAKWEPIVHNVTFSKTEDAAAEKEEQVPHGSKADGYTSENPGYEFIGWFYKDEEGVEHAFDLSMAVTRDMQLYAKWRANTYVDYVIHYQLADGTPVAVDTTGKALALTSKTFEAKTGSELNELYRSGYFPNVSSHTLEMKVGEGVKNEFIFVYTPKAEVNYTVRYLEKGTNDVLHEEKHAATRDAVVTEKFVYINGYAADAYQKRLVLSADDEKNVITFWYVKDAIHAPVHIEHLTQNIEGNDYTLYQESTELNGTIGEERSESPLNIPGFTYNAEKSIASGVISENGLELKLYYDRIEYPYEFRFLEQGTNKVLADPVSGWARYQAQVTQTAKVIPGYTLVSPENQAMNIAIEDPAGEANKNVRIFYYTENTVNINYVAVQPAGAGNTLSSYADNNVKVVTGTVDGSTPNPNAPTYKFVGWFKDEACTIPVNDPTWVDANGKITPQKETLVEGQTATGYKAATYYAKFVLNAVKVKVTKLVTGNFGDKSKRFDIYEGKDRILMLLHNVPAELQNVLVNTKITWREDCVGYTTTAVCMVNNEKFADATVTYNAEGNPVIEFDFTNNPLPGDAEITITNHKEAHPDTGVLLDSLPYILIIACVAAIGAFIVIRRRKNRED